jgi:hypothetical protein
MTPPTIDHWIDMAVSIIGDSSKILCECAVKRDVEFCIIQSRTLIRQLQSFVEFLERQPK